MNLICMTGPMLGDLLHALEEYLPVLLGLVKDGDSKNHFIKLQQFVFSYDHNFLTSVP